MSKIFTLSDRCVLLRYNLRHNKKDVFGITHKYAVYPSDGNGGINYFDDDESLVRWIDQVKVNRLIQGEGITLLEYLEKG